MSLIHDALKKAEDAEPAPIGSGLTTFHDAMDEKKPAISPRVLVLLLLLVAAVGFLVYVKFFTSGGESVQPEVPAAGPLAAEQPSDAAAGKARAVEAFRAGDLEGAWTAITGAVALAPSDAEAWNNLGLIAKKRGDLARARQAYQRALELKPDYPEAQNNLAVVEMLEGNAPRARELLEKAVEASPAYAEAVFNLALVYDHVGEREPAVKNYKRFLQVSAALPSNIVEAVRDRVMALEPR
jgi:Tfp pilus assembly protein PilF